MRLLDEPISSFQKEEMLRMLEGEKCRICVSDNPEEIIKMLGFAVDNLSMLAYNRMLELKEREEK